MFNIRGKRLIILARAARNAVTSVPMYLLRHLNSRAIRWPMGGKSCFGGRWWNPGWSQSQPGNDGNQSRLTSGWWLVISKCFKHILVFIDSLYPFFSYLGWSPNPRLSMTDCVVPHPQDPHSGTWMAVREGQEDSLLTSIEQIFPLPRSNLTVTVWRWTE